jgi:transcriptional regulator with XRE-family HTH domain
MTTFGEKVRELRLQKKMTLRQLAREVGLSQPFLSDIEHGRRFTNQIHTLALCLGVAPEVLEELDPRRKTLSVEERLERIERRLHALERSPR